MALNSIPVPPLCPPASDVSADPSPASDTIHRLTHAIVRGDQSAFATFYDQYSGRVYGLLLILTRGRPEPARELQQVVMIKVARKFRVFATEPELWAWLSQVARNAFRDYARAEARRLKTAPVDLDACTAAGAQNAEPMLEWLDDALQKLDEPDRQLIEAFYFGNQPQKEIAVASGQTPKAVESKLARVRARLRALLLRKTRHEN